MTRRIRYVTSADGEVLSELDVEIPETGHHHDPRRPRRWVTRPVQDPWDRGDHT